MMSGSSDSSLGRTSGGGYPKTTSFNPRSLLKRHPPPVAAHLRTPNCPPGLDLSRPLLIYSNYVSTKIRATSLRLYRDGSLARIGPPLVIPDTYSGWFAVISSDGSTAPCFNSIEQVVSANVSFFLTRYDAPAYVIKENEIGLTSYKRTLVPGGNVLKLLGVFEDFSSRISDAPSKFFGCKKYAQCQDFNNQVVYLPLNISGKFYSTAQKLTSRSFSNVYLISHLLKNFKLPLTVKLVCGYMPRAPCSFTGILRLEKSQQEEVMLACTMTSEAHATLFEIEVDSNFIFTPITDPLFPKTPIYLKTISYCQDGADSWQRQIKVTHHVTEKRSNSLSRSMSEKFVEPLQSVKSFNLALIMDSNRKRSTKEKPLKNRIEDSFIRQYAKRNLKKSDKRKLRSSKNDPYVFQLIRRHRSLSGMLPPIPNSKVNMDVRLSQSFDNLNYCKVLDDISTILERNRSDVDDDEEDDHYTTIGDPTNNQSEQTREQLSTEVSHKEITNNKDKYEVDSDTEGDTKNKSDSYNNKEKDISKKESVDSGMYVDYDESYFSMDYSVVNTSSSDGSSEILNKSKERTVVGIPGNFTLGMTHSHSMSTNLPPRGMGKETVSLLSYRETGTESSFSNGILKNEADKSIAPLTSKKKTPEAKNTKNRNEKVHHTKSLEIPKYNSDKKLLCRSTSLLDSNNDQRHSNKYKNSKKLMANEANEKNRKQITGKNLGVQSTGAGDNARGNSVLRKDEYLIEGEDVSVINIEMSTKSDVLLRTSRLNDVHGKCPDENVSTIQSERKSNGTTSFTLNKNATSSDCIIERTVHQNTNNDLLREESLANVNEGKGDEEDKKEVKVDLECLKKVKAVEETENHIAKQEDHGRNDNDEMCSGNNFKASIQDSDAKMAAKNDCGNKKLFSERESRLGSSRILMRGNTVVIRVKDAEIKRPRISDKTFERSEDKKEFSPQINFLSNDSSLKATHNTDINRKSNIPSINIKRNISTVKINKSDQCNSEFDNTLNVGFVSLPDTKFPTICNEEIELSCDVNRAKGDIINSSNNENSLEHNCKTKGAIKDYNEHNESNKLKDTNNVINNCAGNKINFKINDVYKVNYTCNNAQYNGFPRDANIDYDMTSLTNTPFSINDGSFPENNILHNFDVRRLNSFKISNDISRKEENLIIKNSGNIKFSTITDLSDKYSLEDWNHCKEEGIRNNNIVTEEKVLTKETNSKCDGEVVAMMNSTLPSCQHVNDIAHFAAIPSEDPPFPVGVLRISALKQNDAKNIKECSEKGPSNEDIPSSVSARSRSCSNHSSSISSTDLVEASNTSISADQFGVVVLTLTSNGFCDTEKKIQENKQGKIITEGSYQSEC